MSDPVAWHSQIAPDFDANYDQSSAFKERLTVWSQLIEKFVHPCADVLDAGCGSGVFSLLAAQRATSVVGIDASVPMIEIAETRRQQKGCTNVVFQLATLEDDSFSAGRRFDVILCSSVLEYVADFWPTIDRLMTAMRPAGILIFSMPNGASLYRKIEPLLFRLTGKPAYYGHVRHILPINEIAAGLASRRLRVVTTQYYAATPLLSALARRINRAELADNLFVMAVHSAG
jgi:2-polyprenyl-6-hydroxyphenyl methylase/3-demethylubiquinone-9 3-methyltransferase